MLAKTPASPKQQESKDKNNPPQKASPQTIDAKNLSLKEGIQPTSQKNKKDEPKKPNPQLNFPGLNTNKEQHQKTPSTEGGKVNNSLSTHKTAAPVSEKPKETVKGSPSQKKPTEASKPSPVKTPPVSKKQDLISNPTSPKEMPPSQLKPTDPAGKLALKPASAPWAKASVESSKTQEVKSREEKIENTHRPSEQDPPLESKIDPIAFKAEIPLSSPENNNDGVKQDLHPVEKKESAFKKMKKKATQIVGQAQSAVQQVLPSQHSLDLKKEVSLPQAPVSDTSSEITRTKVIFGPKILPGIVVGPTSPSPNFPQGAGLPNVFSQGPIFGPVLTRLSNFYAPFPSQYFGNLMQNMQHGFNPGKNENEILKGRVRKLNEKLLEKQHLNLPSSVSLTVKSTRKRSKSWPPQLYPAKESKIKENPNAEKRNKELRRAASESSLNKEQK